MKKNSFHTLLLVAGLTLASVSCTQNKYDSMLPKAAQSLIHETLGNVEIADVDESENKMVTYVELVNGTELEFDNLGNWEEINFKRNRVPEAFLQTLPDSITQYINTHHADKSIRKVTKKSFGRKNHVYRISFNKPDNIELIFTKEGELISDDPIGKRLPSSAVSFLETHFGDTEISSIVEDVDGDYEITLEDRTEVEFDRKGNWFYINAKKKQLPASVIDLLPKTAQSYVASKYPEQYIRRIERKSYGYRVKLNKPKDLELCFSKNGAYIRQDGATE